MNFLYKRGIPKTQKTKLLPLLARGCLYIVPLLTLILMYKSFTDDIHVTTKETPAPAREDLPMLHSPLIGKKDTLIGSTEGLTTPSSHVKGVILFLYGGGQWRQLQRTPYFLEQTLPRLQGFFLDCFPKKYPVHIFHEGELTASKTQQNITGLIPSATRVDFEDVGRFWKLLPKGVSEDELKMWIAKQRRILGRSYRIMCRFWAGLVWTLPSMSKYDYYWRLDTDSILLAPFPHDPFEVMVKSGCEYGYNHLTEDYPDVVVNLYDTYKEWANLFLTKEVSSKVKRLITNPHNGKYNGTMFFNNFEIGSFRLKRSEIYQSLFKYIDEHPPFGIMRYRWGDAPIHTIGVYAALGGETGKICLFNRSEYQYVHAPDISAVPVSDKCHGGQFPQAVK
eukprot:Tbor_TRINITY_DN5750_c3_g3::TRINITY_DN5750_c3_g3_i6::g.19538::m.19538/K10967/KTR1_3; alpha 1,2-mannosyltransferase